MNFWSCSHPMSCHIAEYNRECGSNTNNTTSKWAANVMLWWLYPSVLGISIIPWVGRNIFNTCLPVSDHHLHQHPIETWNLLRVSLPHYEHCFLALGALGAKACPQFVWFLRITLSDCAINNNSSTVQTHGCHDSYCTHSSFCPHVKPVFPVDAAHFQIGCIIGWAILLIKYTHPRGLDELSLSLEILVPIDSPVVQNGISSFVVVVPALWLLPSLRLCPFFFYCGSHSLCRDHSTL